MKTPIHSKISASTLIVFSVFGCSDENAETASVTIPLYIQCIETVDDYENFIESSYKSSRYKPKFQIEYFDKRSYAHPSIVGYLTISSHWSGKTEAGLSPLQSLEVNANGIMGECFPESKFSFNMNATTIPEVRGFIRENQARGIAEHYLSLNGEDLEIFFNGGDYSLPELPEP